MQHAVVFLGAGPAGLGPLVCAAQAGQLAPWLDRGVAVLDRRAAPASDLSRYALRADSFGTSFLECAEAASAEAPLVRLRESAEAAALRPLRDAHPPLDLAAAYLLRLELEMERAVAAHPRSAFARGREIAALDVASDHVQVRCAGGEAWRAEAAVVAFGGAQTHEDAAAASLGARGPLGLVAGDRLMTSDHALRVEGLAEALARLAAAPHPEVLIVGGSHNAFSVAWLLAERAPAGLLAPGAVTIASRRAPRIFYRSADEAAADGYAAFTRDDLCPRTGRVHQLGGLRGDGRDLWRRVTGRPGTAPEPRVRLSALDAPDLGARLDRAALIIAATGYRPRLPPVFRDGARLALSGDAGGPSVDASCRLLTAAGEPLDRVFSLGLASGFLPSGEMGGEPSFRGHTNGVWLYQNRIGARVLAGLEAVLARGPS
jgi:hypothetical protein